MTRTPFQFGSLEAGKKLYTVKSSYLYGPSINFEVQMWYNFKDMGAVDLQLYCNLKLQSLPCPNYGDHSLIDYIWRVTTCPAV
jgi:hypothetical protein